jgi:hydroxypyruvate isomerase
MDTLSQDFKRLAFRQDLSRIAPIGETVLTFDFWHAQTTSGDFAQRLRKVGASR